MFGKSCDFLDHAGGWAPGQAIVRGGRTAQHVSGEAAGGGLKYRDMNDGVWVL
jgi:hypothetical protein